MSKNDKDFAIVMGINSYPDEIGPLNGAVNDANNFIKWLVDPAGGNLPEENIRLIQERNDLSAIDVQTEIEELMFGESDFLDEKVGRRLYLFFSGHGISYNSEDAWLLLPQAKEQNYHLHSIAGKESAKALVESTLFDEVILIMDCCRNQHQWQEMPTFPLFKPTPLPGNPTNYCYAFAATWGEKAIETDLDAQSETDDFGGIFTTAFLGGLKGGAPRDKDGNITASTLQIHLEKALPELAQKYKVRPQTPTVLALRGHQIFFGSPLQKTTVEVTVPPGTNNRHWLAHDLQEINVDEEKISETVFRYELTPNQLKVFVYQNENGETVQKPLLIPAVPEGKVHDVTV